MNKLLILAAGIALISGTKANAHNYLTQKGIYNDQRVNTKAIPKAWPDSIVYYDHITQQPVNKVQFQYNSTGLPINILYLNKSDNQWITYEKEIQDYDQSGNVISDEFYVFKNQQWVGIDKSTYAFDQYNNIREHANYLWENGKWIGIDKYENVYEDKEQLRETRYYVNDYQETTQWILSSKEIYIHTNTLEKCFVTTIVTYLDNNNTDTALMIQFPNGSMNYPINQYELAQTYNEDKLLEKIEVLLIENNTKIPTSTYTFKYINNLPTEIKDSAHALNNVVGLDSFLYDTNGNTTLEATYRYDYNNKLQGQHKQTYIYNDNNQLTYSDVYHWNMDTENWIPVNKESISRDQHGNITDDEILIYDQNNQWIGDFKQTTEYNYLNNSEEIVTKITSYIWDPLSNQWEVDNYGIPFPTNYTNNQTVQNNEQIKVWTDKEILYVLTQHDNTKVNVYNANGTLIHQSINKQGINNFKLNKGVFLVKVNNVTRKIYVK